jgi:hypothetical protein
MPIITGIISGLIAFVLPRYALSIPMTPNAIYIKFGVFIVLWIVLTKMGSKK